MPYFQKTNGDLAVLILGIAVLIILIFISLTVIGIKCRNRKIKFFFLVGLVIQIIILIIDNYIIAFPTLETDARAFEYYGWFSYENKTNIGRGLYNDFIINPIYKILKVRVAIIFGAINIFLHILINLNLLSILKSLKIKEKIKEFVIGISILSPITLITRAGILREAIIVFLLSESLKFFINSSLYRNNFKFFISCILLGIAALFHGGVLFIGTGYALKLISSKNKNQKIYQLFLIIVVTMLFFVFKDRLLIKVGGGDLENILKVGNSQVLREAGSAYLQGVDMGSLNSLLLYLPLKIFYFLFSPTPDMIRGIIDVLVFFTNSMIYIYMIFSIIKLNKKNKCDKLKKDLVKYLIYSSVAVIIVFSIGTHNAGTAMRHRDKLMILFIIIYSILKNEEINNEFRKNICKSSNMDTRNND